MLLVTFCYSSSLIFFFSFLKSVFLLLSCFISASAVKFVAFRVKASSSKLVCLTFYLSTSSYSATAMVMKALILIAFLSANPFTCVSHLNPWLKLRFSELKPSNFKPFHLGVESSWPASAIALLMFCYAFFIYTHFSAVQRCIIYVQPLSFFHYIHISPLCEDDHLSITLIQGPMENFVISLSPLGSFQWLKFWIPICSKHY